MIDRVGTLLLSLAPHTVTQVDTLDPLPRRVAALFTTVDSAATPGCVVGVAQDGRTVLLQAYGRSDLESLVPNDSSTIFEAGSVSKQFAAAAVLMLVRDGTLALEDPVRRWIPELAADLPTVTVRHLLHHQSGWRDWGDLVELAGWSRGTRLHDPQTVLELLARQHGLNFAPGAEYNYSNTNYVLLSIVVARAAKQTFAEFSRTRLFAPLGMTHTQWRTDYTMRVPHRATAWTPDDAGAWHLDMPFENVVGHGGLLTTVPDLLRWQEALRTRTLLGDSLHALMELAGVLRNGAATSYAMGLERGQSSGALVISHSGSTAGYRSYVGRAPERAVSVALLCNAGSLNTEELGPSLMSAALADSVALPPMPRVSAVSPTVTLGAARNDALTGLYRNARTRQAVTLQHYEGGLTLNRRSVYGREGDGFVSADGARRLRVQRTATGAVKALEVLYAAGDTLLYERVDPAPLTGAARNAVLGTYVSTDADARWTLRLRGDTLVVQRREGLEEPLQPVYRDAFETVSSGWLLTFRRDASGQVVGLDAGRTRSRTVPFERLVPRAVPARR